MDIYLVRVCQRADNSLFLERKPKATTDDDYIAISHVWGTPETITPTEVDGAGAWTVDVFSHTTTRKLTILI